MISNSRNGSEGSPPSESSSVFSYESSEGEGHFSYSDLSPDLDDDSFDLVSGMISIIHSTNPP